MAQLVSEGIDLASMTPEELDVLIKEDFALFTQAMYRATKSDDLIWAPYLDLVCSYLADVAHGRRRNLIITLPPRHLKSFCVSVALVAFFLGHYPKKQVMVISYAQELARELARECLAVMQCEDYRALFGEVLAPGRQQIHLLRTAEGGRRRATSIDGTATGTGADLQIFDDPQKPGETYSDAIRRAVNARFGDTFFGRGNNALTVRRIIVMQRLHENDFVGHVMGLPMDWDLINLPAIAEDNQAIPYNTLFGPRVFRRKEGEALHPKRLPLPELLKIRDIVGEAVWASHYQQNPTPAGGGLVKTEWFRRYGPLELPDRFDRIIQSWDTANTVEQWSDYSVCTTWGVKGKHAYLLHVFRERLLFPALMRAVLEQAHLHGPSTVFIEDHASGTQIYQTLHAEGFGLLRKVKSTSSKEERMIAQTGKIENGFVHIPAHAPWTADYLHEMGMFPNGKHDDQVDSTSQALAGIATWTPASTFIEYIRIDQEAQRERAEALFVIKPTDGQSLFGDINGELHRVREDGYLYLNFEQASPILNDHRFKVISRPEPIN